jgi:hypothetical protein
MELRARATLLAEGCRGSLSEVRLGVFQPLAALHRAAHAARCVAALHGAAVRDAAQRG